MGKQRETSTQKHTKAHKMEQKILDVVKTNSVWLVREATENTDFTTTEDSQFMKDAKFILHFNIVKALIEDGFLDKKFEIVDLSKYDENKAECDKFIDDVMELIEEFPITDGDGSRFKWYDLFREYEEIIMVLEKLISF